MNRDIMFHQLIIRHNEIVEDYFSSAYKLKSKVQQLVQAIPVDISCP
jgi:hypothetical protein